MNTIYSLKLVFLSPKKYKVVKECLSLGGLEYIDLFEGNLSECLAYKKTYYQK